MVLVVKGQAGVEEPPASEDPTQGTKPPATIQGHAGSLIPATAWRESSHVQVVWSVKWAAQGLVPVRAQVVATSTITLGAAQALNLSV